MTEIFFAAFDYDILRVGRYGRAGTTALRRATAAIEIPAARGSGLSVAYRVQHERDLGPGWHRILRHDGKLWWPMVERTVLGDVRDARDFLRELRAGRCDLFVQRGLDHLFLESRRRRRVTHDGHDEALAAVCRNAGNLLIVDDGLYGAGGVPLLVETSDGIHIASTGADRAVAVRAGALRIKPAIGRRGGMDHAISRGFCYLPGDPPDEPMVAEARASRWAGFDGIAIETIDGEAIDPIVVRVDAAFRTAWWAMNRSIPRTRPEGFDRLRAVFVEACGPGGDDGLTAARYRALQGFVELFETAEPKPVAVSEGLTAVRSTITAAAGSDRVLDPELSPTENEALACLV